MAEIETIEITNEEQAFACLQDVLDDSFDDYTRIKFAGWPRFEMRITGRNYDSSIPTSIMPPMLDMQKVIHKLYCRIIHGHQNLRRLTKRDLDRLEIVITVGAGSSNFTADLTAILNYVVQQSICKMSSRQVTASVIICALLITSHSAWKSHLNYQAEIEQMKQETVHMRISSDARKIRLELRLLSVSIDDFRKHFLRCLKPQDELFIDGELVTREKVKNSSKENDRDFGLD